MRRQDLIYAVLLILLLTGAAVAGSPDQEAWNHFLNWYKTYTGPPFPGDAMKAYSAELAAGGLDPAGVKQRLALLQRMAASSPTDLMTIHFDKVFTHHPNVFSGEPNAFLTRVVRDLKPGKALDMAMGQGRNSVFLATRGWDVTGYDLSGQGLATARANAAKARVRIETVLSTHRDFDFGKERWNLILMTYAFVNMEDEALLRHVKESLTPGGIVVVEQLNSGGTGKGPANALFNTFRDLRVIHYEDVVDVADWSRKSARIGRLAAQRE